MSSVLALAAVIVAACTGRSLVRGAVTRARSAAAEQQAVEALRGLTGELAAGGSPIGSLRAVVDDLDGPGRGRSSPVADSLSRAAATDDEPAASRVLREPGPPGLVAMAAAWQVSASTGAPLADVLARLAAAATRAADDARDVRTILAGPRTTARLLAGLPLLGLVLGSSSGARPFRFLLHTTGGSICLLLGVTLDAGGLLWIERLARPKKP